MEEPLLSEAQQALLRAMAAGVRLKDHRDIDGRKVFRLHPVDGEPQEVDAELVRSLVEAGLISSNKKFPSATYWLRSQG